MTDVAVDGTGTSSSSPTAHAHAARTTVKECYLASTGTSDKSSASCGADRSATSRLPVTSSRLTSKLHGGVKPPAVSKIASLWKNSNNVTPASFKGKLPGGKSPAKMKAQRVTSAGVVSRNTLPLTGKLEGAANNDYVSSISFRDVTIESTSEGKPSAPPISHHKDLFIENEAVARSASPSSPRRVMDKTSAIVTPYRYKHPQRNVSPSSLSLPGSASSDGSASLDTVADNSSYRGFTSQTTFYEQEKKITVHLDIKPCITVSDVTGLQPLENDNISNPESVCCLGTGNPSSKPLINDLSKTTNSSPLTKTEMLLKRRSEILNRRKANGSTEFDNRAHSPSHRHVQKTTDV